MIQNIFNIKHEEKYECEDCGETEKLQFGICCICGGDVVKKENEI